jgi:alkylation response protein AidB-like acyl-CoA dehydrogenase
LVRTDTTGRKQQGITLLLIALDTPGITRRAIETIDGWHHVNEVFLDNVRVPATHRVGEEGQAWGYAKYLLDRERVGASTVPQLIQLLRSAQRAVRAHVDATVVPRGRHSLEERLLHAEAELVGVRELAVKAIDDAKHGRPLGSRPSALKLKCSELSQDIVAIGMEAVGPAMARRFLGLDDSASDTLMADATWMHNYLFYRSKTIAGGTSEILRNVIARELFGAS